MKPRTPARLVGLLCLLASCNNNPYRQGETAQSTYFSSFGTAPTNLDPTGAYYSHEGKIIDQIYEPPFTYHYLKRPYELIPQTSTSVPAPQYFDVDGNRMDATDPPADQVGRAEYTVELKRGILYQNHPCFARDEGGQPFYAGVTAKDIEDYEYPSQFPRQATRELRAMDYALQIRRLADPRLASPIFSAVARYILGMEELQQSFNTLTEDERARRRAAAGPSYNQERDEKENPIRLDYMEPAFPGVEVLGDYSYKIVLKRKYPQILYWMSMHFFAPVPVEAVDFYAQAAMIERQFSLAHCPVGTGPYTLETFRPNEIIVLARNPNYHDDFYPTEGEAGDQAAGLLDDAGERLPFIERQVLRLEKEAIPNWNKFLQGYTDAAGIVSDVYDQAIQMQGGEGPSLSDRMAAKGIRLITGIDATLWYTSFNMRDDVVGGYDPRTCALRQAISIALDYNEFLDIFLNGRGVLSQGPIPPGIFGYRPGPEGVNPYCDAWDAARKRYVRKPIDSARALMVEAGYPEGRGPDGKPLTLFYDHSAGADPWFRSYFDWVRGRLDLIGVRIKDRGTELSRFRQKRRQGNWQISSGGWLADYPDPENFLFLFYGPNGKVEYGGPNMVNFENETYDALFREMESMENSPKRQDIIDRMMDILQHDAPAAWQYHPVSYLLVHKWYGNVKPHNMSYNTMKYRRIDPLLRVQRQREWNRPVIWPVVTLLIVLIAGTLPAAILIYRRERC